MALNSNVERRRLKYAATINDEALSEETGADYELQYVDISNVDSLGKIHEITTYPFSEAPSRARRRVRDGDVIISCVRTYLQAIAPVQDPPENLIVSTGFAVVRPCVGVLDATLGKYVLREPSFLAEVEMRSVGVSYPAINASDLGDIPVHLPPEPNQRAIADYLDRETARLDALVAAKERVLGLLAEKRRSLITRAVTRGLDPDAPLHDSGIPWLGKMPAHWTQCHLKRTLVGVDYGISIAVDTEGAVAVLRMGDLHDGELDYSGVGFVEEVDEALLLQRGDLVFNRTNSLDQIGKVALFRGKEEYPVSFASYLVRFRCGPSVLPEFLNYVLNSSFPQAWGRAEALPAIGQANLNPNRFGYLPIVLPPLAEQEEIVGYLSPALSSLRSVRAATERTIDLLKERRSALIAAAVTGQLDVGSVA